MSSLSLQLQSPFHGTPFSASLIARKHAKSSFYFGGRKQFLPSLSPRRSFRQCNCSASKRNSNNNNRNNWITRAVKFSNSCGKYVVFLSDAIGSRNGIKVECVSEPFTQSKALVARSLAPLWKEGLLLFRGSICVAVVSGVCLLVWYGQKKAKSYVEAKLLPSVCSVLSDYIQREIDFGKVRGVSPLSITLESCSIGPHAEEFSCGEVATMKLRLCPLASLRRGKVVIDAVLSHPSLLIVQKKDYTWLGLPSSDGCLERHLSTEDGIDYRTKARRISREEAAARWAGERDNHAKEAAEKGYVATERYSSFSENSVSKEDLTRSINVTNYESFLCMDEKMHWTDHHCMDTGLDYDMKHADLEKSFGVKFPGSGLKFWSSMIEGPKRRIFKRKANGADISAAGVNAKRRILERSASAASTYFHGLPSGKDNQNSQPSHDNTLMNLDTLLGQSHTANNADISNFESSGEECLTADSQDEEYYKNLAIRSSTVNQHYHSHTYDFNLIRNPFFGTLYRLIEIAKVVENFPSIRNVAGDAKTDSVKSDNLSRNMDAHSPEIENSNASEDCSPEKLEPGPATSQPIPSSNLSSSASFPRQIRESLHHFFAGPIRNLKSGVGTTVEDIFADLVGGVGVDLLQTEGIEKMLPVSLDSVHFKGGTLMLLAYGDREPREMENVKGLVKFQNHYSGVHVQLSGNCKMWESDAPSEDGGWLSADVFVDSVEQNWHANLKIAKLFAPLFERILDIPIAWSKGRATGEVLF